MALHSAAWSVQKRAGAPDRSAHTAESPAPCQNTGAGPLR